MKSIQWTSLIVSFLCTAPLSAACWILHNKRRCFLSFAITEKVNKLKHFYAVFCKLYEFTKQWPNNYFSLLWCGLMRSKNTEYEMSISMEMKSSLSGLKLSKVDTWQNWFRCHWRAHDLMFEILILTWFAFYLFGFFKMSKNDGMCDAIWAVDLANITILKL